MGFFDKLKNNVENTANSIANDIGSNPDGLANASCVSNVLDKIPSSVDELKTMDGADLKDPNKVIALTIAAFCSYPVNKDICIEMLNFLKGPKPLSPYEKQFLRDRLSGKEYVISSYFDGATPQNNYEPKSPYTIKVYKTPHSEDLIGEGYLQLFLKSGGADNARGIKLRSKPSTGQWFLWEYFILPDIRKPVASDPWA